MDYGKIAQSGPEQGNMLVDNGDGTFSWISPNGENAAGGTDQADITADPSAWDTFLTQVAPEMAGITGLGVLGPMFGMGAEGADAADSADGLNMLSTAGSDSTPFDSAVAAESGGGGGGGLFNGAGPALINTAGSFLKSLFTPQRNGFTGNVDPQTLLNNEVSAGENFGNAMGERAATPITTPGASISTPGYSIPGLDLKIGGQNGSVAPRTGTPLNLPPNLFGTPPSIIPPKK